MLFGISYRNWFILISLILGSNLFLYIFLKSKIKAVKFICLCIPIVISLIGFYLLKNFYIVGIYYLLPTLVIFWFIFLLTYEKPLEPIWDVALQTSKRRKVIRRIDRGVAIFGSAGSGKTISCILPILQHFAKSLFSGIIYDYKNGELTELAIPLFKERLKIISVHDPDISFRVNPISPRYLSGEEKDVNQIVKVLLDNLLPYEKKTDFFIDTASSLLSAVILKFYFEHKELCTLPHVIAFILAVDFSLQKESLILDESVDEFGKLQEFLTSDKRVAIQASSFILGLASPKQTAGVISTLANALRKLSFPELFYVLSADEIDLNVNDKEIDTVISVMNEPKNDDFLSPINATIIHCISKQMMNRGRKQSFILLDEAPTIKLLNMARIPATMRSFGVSVIYCAQDISQGIVAYTKDGFKEIISNLSTQFFGKSNDSETSKFYESYFELVKEKTKSVSSKGGSLFSFGDTTVTVSEKEVHKYRASEFNKLKVGQFAFSSDGVGEIVTMNKPKIVTENIPKRKEISKERLTANFHKIIEDVEQILN